VGPDFAAGVALSRRLSSPRYPSPLSIFLAFSGRPFTDSGLCRDVLTAKRFYNIPLVLMYVEVPAILPALRTICIPSLGLVISDGGSEFERVEKPNTGKQVPELGFGCYAGGAFLV
jgi:hypothetical protein